MVHSSLGELMRRRDFVTFVGGAAAAAFVSPRLGRTQERVGRIGWLELGHADDPAVQERVAGVEDELAKLGWTVGRNLQIDFRWGATSVEIGQQLGAELLGLSPDVVLTVGTPGVKALQQATKTVPIVFILVAEPVDQGFVQSLAHPGGNITGFAYLERTIGAKWLALLTEIAPRTKRVAYIFSPKAAPYAHFYYEAAQAVATERGVQLDIDPVTDTAELESVLAHLGSDGGVIFNADAFMNNNTKLAIDLAARYRVPAIYGSASGAKDGCLISYNLDIPAQFRQAAPYLDRILRGEKPADLPVQQPAKFSYTINLKTAKALGLNVPLTMQVTADEVID
jgi:putative tryptophan/tyrosine transport system substrate-binding protein